MSLTDIAEDKKTKSGFYNEGYDAYVDGCLYELNPYVQDTIEYENWHHGWLDAEENLSYDDE